MFKYSMDQMFEIAFEKLIGHEGGYVNDPKDPGGETKYGVSKKAYPNLDIKNLTLEQAKEIFKKDYWKPFMNLDINPVLIYMIVDCAYNSGVPRAKKLLQRTLSLKEDGIIGRKTLSTLHNKNSLWLIENYSNTRIAFLQSLPTFPRYGRGWVTRVNDIRRFCTLNLDKPAPLH